MYSNLATCKYMFGNQSLNFKLIKSQSSCEIIPHHLKIFLNIDSTLCLIGRNITTLITFHFFLLTQVNQQP